MLCAKHIFCDYVMLHPITLIMFLLGGNDWCEQKETLLKAIRKGKYQFNSAGISELTLVCEAQQHRALSLKTMGAIIW